MLICIDPGHGGYDPGALGKNGTKECDVALDVARELKKELESARLSVILTRERDEYISLTTRADIANKAGAQYFISIHLNSATNPTPKGSEAWIYPGAEPDKALAATLLNDVCQKLYTASRGVKEEEFTVLKATTMPAVLMELLFISNPAEEEIANSATFAKTAATAIAKGLCSFLGISYGDTEHPSEEHWAKKYLDKLVEKGIISSPEVWEDFDKPPLKGQVLALINKLYDKINNDGRAF